VKRKLERNFKLKDVYEYLRVDLTLYHPGTPWGNLVMVEHENDICGFEDEIEKLMSVLAPLKVGITYGNARQEEELLKLIRDSFENRHPEILENPKTEYLFLLGVDEPDRVTWKYLLFTTQDGPSREQFEAVENATLVGRVGGPSFSS